MTGSYPPKSETSTPTLDEIPADILKVGVCPKCNALRGSGTPLAGWRLVDGEWTHDCEKTAEVHAQQIPWTPGLSEPPTAPPSDQQHWRLVAAQWELAHANMVADLRERLKVVEDQIARREVEAHHETRSVACAYLTGVLDTLKEERAHLRGEVDAAQERTLPPSPLAAVWDLYHALDAGSAAGDVVVADEVLSDLHDALTGAGEVRCG